MPKLNYKGRGKVIRYRTIIKLPKGKYAHITIVSKLGKRGGHTIIGKIRKSKKKMF